MCIRDRHTADACKTPGPGPEAAGHTNLLDAPLGKAVTIIHVAVAKAKGSPHKSACCQTLAWRDTPSLEASKEEETAKNKAHEKNSVT